MYASVGTNIPFNIFPTSVLSGSNSASQLQDPFSIEKLIRMNQMVFKISSVWPFDFFPDTVVLDENKISIYTRNFFFSNDVRSILYKDVQYVEVYSSIIFATLIIRMIGFPHDMIIVKYLRKADAFKARRIIQGFMECCRAKVDLSLVEPSERLRQVERLGTAHGKELSQKVHFN